MTEENETIIPEPTKEQVDAYDLDKASPLLWEMWCACQILRQIGFDSDYIYAAFSERTILEDKLLKNHASVVLRKPPYPDFTLVIGPYTEQDAEDWRVFIEAIRKRASNEMMERKFRMSWAMKHAGKIWEMLVLRGIDIPEGTA